MRVKIVLHFKGDLKLPISYNNLIQGLIYSHVSDTNKRDILHNYGYMVGSKKIKLMTFSRLLGEYEINSKEITFRSQITLIFSSFDDELVSDISYNLMKDKNMYLNGCKLDVFSVQPYFFDIEKYVNRKSYVIEMLSPLSVSSTNQDGKRVYFKPDTIEFVDALRKNIKTKLKAIKQENKEFSFNIMYNNIPNHRDEKVIYFKNTFIKGYNGIFTVNTDPFIMKLLYYSGIGSKNSEGFGCFNILGIKND